MLPGQQKRPESETDDDRQLNRVESLVDPSTKHSGGQRVNKRVLQRPPSPRLLLPQHDSTRSFELQRNLSFNSPAVKGSRDRYEQDSTPTPHKGVTRLKRPHSTISDRDFVEGPPFLPIRYSHSEEKAPSTSTAVSTTIRKRENRSSFGGNGKDSNNDFGLEENNNNGLARGQLNPHNSNLCYSSAASSYSDSVSSPHQHSPPTAATSNSMNDKLEIEIGKTPAGFQSRLHHQHKLNWQDDPCDRNENQRLATTKGDEMISDRNDSKGGAKSLKIQNNVDRGEGGGKYGQDIEILARRLRGRRQKTKISRGNWSAGLNEQWRKEGKSIIVLIVLGVFGSTVDAGIDAAIRSLSDLSNVIVTSVPNSSRFVESVLFTLYMVLGTCLGVALTALVAPDVSGSGLPLMKWIIGTDGMLALALFVNHKLTQSNPIPSFVNNQFLFHTLLGQMFLGSWHKDLLSSPVLSRWWAFLWVRVLV